MFNCSRGSRLTKVAVIGALSLGALTLAGCSTSGPEEGVDVEDIVEQDAVPEPAPYDDTLDEFYDYYDRYVGETVTVSADVNEIVSPTSFTIAGTLATTVDALLVVHDGSITDIEEGLAVKVTGVVHETFDLPTVEEEMGLDLDDDLYAGWDAVRYIQATSVEALDDE